MAGSVIKKRARLISGPLNPPAVYYLIYIHAGYTRTGRGERGHDQSNRDLPWKVAAILSASCSYIFMGVGRPTCIRDFKYLMKRRSKRRYAFPPTLTSGPRGFSPRRHANLSSRREGGEGLGDESNNNSKNKAAKSSEGRRRKRCREARIPSLNAANPVLRGEDTAKTRGPTSTPTSTPTPTPTRKCAASKAQRGRAKDIAAELAAETDTVSSTSRSRARLFPAGARCGGSSEFSRGDYNRR